MQVAAAQFLGGDHLAGGGLHQGRTAQEDRALLADDHGFVAHRRDVRAARGARTQNRGDLRDARPRHGGLVVEDAAEVLTVGEHVVLHGQERAAGVGQVHAGEAVVQRHLLGAQVLLDRHRVVAAALDGGVVGDHDRRPSGHAADAGDHPGSGGVLAVLAVKAVGGQRGDLQERRTGVEEEIDAVAGEELAAFDVARPGLLGPAEGRGRDPLPQLQRERAVRGVVGGERGTGGVDRRSEHRCPAHGVLSWRDVNAH